MSQPPLPPFQPGAVHVTPGEDETEFENGPDADLATTMTDQDPNWDVNVNPAQAVQGFSEPGMGVQNTPQQSPLATAEEASRIAGAALHLCDANNINLNGKLYLKLEAWTGIARIAGAIPGIETVKDNLLGGVAGITARGTLKTGAGKLLSEAEGFVGNDEPFWAQKPVSDRVNMAQTRAVGRVCRLVYSFIVQIMNKEYGRAYEVTPAEEMLASQQASQQMPKHPGIAFGAGVMPPEPGQRHPMPTQPPAQQWPQQPPNVVPYQQPPQQPPYAPPNQAQSVGQQGETWQGVIAEVRQRSARNNPANIFHVVFLTDGKNASTYNKTLAAQAMQLQGRNVEMLVIPRGQGLYNVGQLRPL